MKSPPERTALNAPESSPIGAGAIHDWESMESRLTPIIGESGFRVLFARSLHRARAAHPWLAHETAPGDSPFSMLLASLESQTPERATQGSRALMGHFKELLIALIGKDLVSRLLDPA